MTDDFENIKLKRDTLQFPGGETVAVSPLGKGSFTKAFLGADGFVYLFTREGEDTGDYSKEILANIDSSNPYLPKVETMGYFDGGRVYRMPRYNVPLRKGDSATAWAEYKILAKCRETAYLKVMTQTRRSGSIGIWNYGYTIADETMACAEGDFPEVVEALQELADAMVNYGTGYTFEFAPRNLGTDASGHLILLDVTYDMEAMEKKRQAAVKGRLRNMKGGRADGKDVDVDLTELRSGVKEEMEHTDDPALALEIALDHLIENPWYYRQLKAAGL